VTRWYGIGIDIDRAKQKETLHAAEKRTLEMVADGASLREVLDQLCSSIEVQVAVGYPANAPTIWQACMNAASSEPNGPTPVSVGSGANVVNIATGSGQLQHLGCYAMGSSVIVPPVQGTFGDMSRYELYSVGTWEWDASIVQGLAKKKKRLTTQFRADFHNVTNSTFFAAPTATLTPPEPSAQPLQPRIRTARSSEQEARGKSSLA
jgi:hypothetical protein